MRKTIVVSSSRKVIFPANGNNIDPGTASVEFNREDVPSTKKLDILLLHLDEGNWNKQVALRAGLFSKLELQALHLDRQIGAHVDGVATYEYLGGYANLVDSLQVLFHVVDLNPEVMQETQIDDRREAVA